MGPLFSILSAIAVAGAIAFAFFVIAVIFLPWRLAIRIALSAAIGGAIGFAGTLVGQTPFYPANLSSKAIVASYLGIAVLGGVAGAILCATMVWQVSRKKG
jgi:hypothetical protein